ncbi:MAG TPA: BON domain-containing protein [Woeseiaceae bacterium]|jgi:osmotically-inducible protein OsmY|nr:BON domain-containing protein [Woeseiaceae bacterium]
MVTDNKRFRAKVTLALDAEPALRDHEIGIAARDGVVTLSGVVDTDAQRLAAERAAARVTGVVVVVDDLRTREFDFAAVTDTEVAHTIAQLLRRKRHHCRYLTARIEHGRVTLEGEASLFSEKAALERRVEAIPGVDEVINLITVTPPELVNDITSRVEAAFREEEGAVDDIDLPFSRTFPSSSRRHITPKDQKE